MHGKSSQDVFHTSINDIEARCEFLLDEYLEAVHRARYGTGVDDSTRVQMMVFAACELLNMYTTNFSTDPTSDAVRPPDEQDWSYQVDMASLAMGITRVGGYQTLFVEYRTEEEFSNGRSSLIVRDGMFDEAIRNFCPPENETQQVQQQQGASPIPNPVGRSGAASTPRTGATNQTSQGSGMATPSNAGPVAASTGTAVATPSPAHGGSLQQRVLGLRRIVGR